MHLNVFQVSLNLVKHVESWDPKKKKKKSNFTARERPQSEYEFNFEIQRKSLLMGLIALKCGLVGQNLDFNTINLDGIHILRTENPRYDSEEDLGLCRSSCGSCIQDVECGCI